MAIPGAVQAHQNPKISRTVSCHISWVHRRFTGVKVTKADSDTATLTSIGWAQNLRRRSAGVPRKNFSRILKIRVMTGTRNRGTCKKLSMTPTTTTHTTTTITFRVFTETAMNGIPISPIHTMMTFTCCRTSNCLVIASVTKTSMTICYQSRSRTTNVRKSGTKARTP